MPADVQQSVLDSDLAQVDSVTHSRVPGSIGQHMGASGPLPWRLKEYCTPDVPWRADLVEFAKPVRASRCSGRWREMTAWGTAIVCKRSGRICSNRWETWPGPGCQIAVDVRSEVLVHRPRGEVAVFMFDPAHDLEWTGGITSSRPARPGPLTQGATVVRTARFLGREFDHGYVVTEHEPDRLVELKVDRPFPMTARYELEDVPDGT